MPPAFTHLFCAWVAGKVYNHRYQLAPSLLGVLVFAGIAPDVDLLIEWVFHVAFHRTLTHSLIGTLMAGLVAYALTRWNVLRAFSLQSRDAYAAAAVTMAGFLIHIFLDIVTSRTGVMLFWPLPYWIGNEGIHMITAMADTETWSVLRIVADAGLGTVWMFYLWARGQLKF